MTLVEAIATVAFITIGGIVYEIDERLKEKKKKKKDEEQDKGLGQNPKTKKW